MEDIKVKIAEIKKDIQYLGKSSDENKEDIKHNSAQIQKRSQEIKDAFYVAETTSQRLEESHDAYKEDKREILEKLEGLEQAIEEAIGTDAKKTVLILQALLGLLAASAVLLGIISQMGWF